MYAITGVTVPGLRKPEGKLVRKIRPKSIPEMK